MASNVTAVTDVGPRTKSLFSQLLNAFAEKPTESPSDKNEHPHSVDTGFLDQIRTISLDEHMPIPLDDPRNEKFSNSVSGAKQYGDLKKKMKKEKKAKKREKLISRFNALPLSRQMAVLRQATEKIDRNFNLMERTDGKLLVTRQIVNFRQLRSAMKRNQKSREKSRSRSRSPAVVH